MQGFPVIAMELAPSGTLNDLVTGRAPIGVTRAVDAVLQVIDGLEAAAALGILHRDVKPTWLPIVPAIVLIRIGPKTELATVTSALVQTVFPPLPAAGAVVAVKRPSRAIQDRIAGTWIVPR